MTLQHRIAAVLRQLRIEHEISIESASEETGQDIEIIESGFVDLRISELSLLSGYYGVADLTTFFEMVDHYQEYYGKNDINQEG